MDASQAIAAFFHIFAGLGAFFTGIGVLWFVSVSQEKRE
jgi:hypothetical protein